jgi:hypothetical protein
MRVPVPSFTQFAMLIAFATRMQSGGSHRCGHGQGLDKRTSTYRLSLTCSCVFVHHSGRINLGCIIEEPCMVTHRLTCSVVPALENNTKYNHIHQNGASVPYPRHNRMSNIATNPVTIEYRIECSRMPNGSSVGSNAEWAQLVGICAELRKQANEVRFELPFSHECKIQYQVQMQLHSCL